MHPPHTQTLADFGGLPGASYQAVVGGAEGWRGSQHDGIRRRQARAGAGSCAPRAARDGWQQGWQGRLAASAACRSRALGMRDQRALAGQAGACRPRGLLHRAGALRTRHGVLLLLRACQHVRMQALDPAGPAHVVHMHMPYSVHAGCSPAGMRASNSPLHPSTKGTPPGLHIRPSACLHLTSPHLTCSSCGTR